MGLFPPGGTDRDPRRARRRRGLVVWDFINVNAGGAALESPYAIPKNRARSLRADSPLRQGSYRSLAAAGNVFARESFMDELRTRPRPIHWHSVWHT